MTEQTLIIAILVALVILWITETLGMHRTSRILGGVIDLGWTSSALLFGCPRAPFLLSALP